MARGRKVRLRKGVRTHSYAKTAADLPELSRVARQEVREFVSVQRPCGCCGMTNVVGPMDVYFAFHREAPPGHLVPICASDACKEEYADSFLTNGELVQHFEDLVVQKQRAVLAEQSARSHREPVVKRQRGVVHPGVQPAFGY